MIISLAQAGINKKFRRCSFAYNKVGGKKQEQQGLKKNTKFITRLST